MTKTEDCIKLIIWVIFTKKGKIWFWSVILSCLDFLKLTKGQKKYPNSALLKQLIFQRYFRNSKSLALFFKTCLRVAITYGCNLNCGFCYAKGLEKDIACEMSLKDFDSLLIWAKQRGWSAIRFLGGEPTVHPHFSEMLKICYFHKMFVSMSTNNTFPAQILPILDRRWISFFSINYCLNSLTDIQKTIFRENLASLSTQGIPFEFSYTIGYKEDACLEIFDDAIRYKPGSIRISIEIPGLSRQTSIQDLTVNFKTVSRKIFEFQDRCLKLNIPLYVYRPLMPCLFSKEEWKRLKGSFPFICYTRCPLGVMGDYGITVVVNPNLSIFPCTSLFIRGPKIFQFEDRKQISDFYKEKIQQIISQPHMPLCKNCERRTQFLQQIKRDRDADIKSSFHEMLCQGGCFSFYERTNEFCQIE